jgi:hypothetical protein
MYWVLTRMYVGGDWADEWLLIGRQEAQEEGAYDVLLTPAIAFEDSAQLLAFLHADGHRIETFQPHIQHWLMANGLYKIGREERTTWKNESPANDVSATIGWE